MSDYQWCVVHNIKPGTFYNWVRRLRQKGGQDIPLIDGLNSYKKTSHQEVVQIASPKKSLSGQSIDQAVIHNWQSTVSSVPAMELFIGKANNQISNG